LNKKNILLFLALLIVAVVLSALWTLDPVRLLIPVANVLETSDCFSTPYLSGLTNKPLSSPVEHSSIQSFELFGAGVVLGLVLPVTLLGLRAYRVIKGTHSTVKSLQFYLYDMFCSAALLLPLYYYQAKMPITEIATNFLVPLLLVLYFFGYMRQRIHIIYALSFFAALLLFYGLGLNAIQHLDKTSPYLFMGAHSAFILLVLMRIQKMSHNQTMTSYQGYDLAIINRYFLGGLCWFIIASALVIFAEYVMWTL
jgi:hypothetical protein